MFYSFQKMVFVGQNLKHVHIFWTFDVLLINSRYLVLPHQRSIVSEYKLHGKPIMKNKPTFSLISDIDVEKTCFFNVKLNYFRINFHFSQFPEHLFRSSHSQMFFKIGAFKNFVILRIKKILQLRSSHLEVFLKKVFAFASWC